jgi:hypothetical protein
MGRGQEWPHAPAPGLGNQGSITMTDIRKERIKKLLNDIPLTAEVFWLVRRSDNPSKVKYSLKHIKENLPETIEAVKLARKHAKPGKKIFLFASMHYWLEHISMMGLALAGQGHDVTLGYFPYAKWNIVQEKFDIRRQAIYTKTILKPAESVMNLVDLYQSNGSYVMLPDEIKRAVDQVTGYDFMYAYQTEEIDTSHEFYQFRYERNMLAAKVLYNYLRSNRPDSVIIPNGTVMELGVAYRVCRYFKIPVVTYEFSEQKQTMWLTQNDEVMKQDTELLWKKYAEMKLSETNKKKIETLISSRKNAVLFTNFSRQWQSVPSEGAMKAKERLGLDDRKVVLLATNVLGDSLTLGRQVFSKSMTEWIIRTIQYFIERKDVQFVIRIHPGEAQIKNGSIYDKIRETLPHLPDHIHVIGPKEDINTYDVMELADVGLVYTTTVGLEMAMSGIPVEVAGKTHYRGRGFTYDPDSWVDYFKILNKLLENPKKTRLSKTQMEQAWKYAYLFFFEYPHPYPWHLSFRQEDFMKNPVKNVLSNDGIKKFGETFELLTFQKKES